MKNRTIIIIRPATQDDAADLCPRLRYADRLELLMAHGPEILTHLQASIKASDLECEAVVINGRVEALYGLSSTPADFNVPWMLGSDIVMKHPRELIQRGRAQLRYWADRFDTPLRNLVMATNTTHVRWLKHIGCTFGSDVLVGPYNSTFTEFSYV